jgi:hypothetical protein
VLQQLSSSSASFSSLNPNDWWIVQLLGTIPANQRQAVFRTFPGLAYFGNGLGAFGSQIGQQLTFGPGGSTAGAGGAWYPTPQFAGLGLGGGSGPVQANLASAPKIGSLSAPPTWVSPEAVEQQAAQMAGVNYVAAGERGGVNGLLNGMPMGGGGRRAAAGFTHKYGFRQSVLTRPLSAG